MKSGVVYKQILLLDTKLDSIFSLMKENKRDKKSYMKDILSIQSQLNQRYKELDNNVLANLRVRPTIAVSNANALAVANAD